MDEPKKFISVPTEVEAMQWTGENEYPIRKWTTKHEVRPTHGGLGGHFVHLKHKDEAWLWVQANEKWLLIKEGEWVIKDLLGFYPCQDNVFQRKYKPCLTTVAEYADNTPVRQFRGVSLDHYPGL